MTSALTFATNRGDLTIEFDQPGRLNDQAAQVRVPRRLAELIPGATERAAEFLEGARRLAQAIDLISPLTTASDYDRAIGELVAANRMGAGGTEWVALAKQWVFEGAQRHDTGGRYPAWVEDAMCTDGWSAVQCAPVQSMAGEITNIFDLPTGKISNNLAAMQLTEGTQIFGVKDAPDTDQISRFDPRELVGRHQDLGLGASS